MVAASQLPRRRFSPQEYLDLERAADHKSEYLDGEIYAMAGASPDHGTIAVNLTAEVARQTRGTPCRPFGSDMRVATDPLRHYCYPDLSVVCGELEFANGAKDVLTNVKVVFEILSPSTERYDRGRKWGMYQQVATLSDYILIAQDEPRIEHFTRQEGGRWLLTVAIGLQAEVNISSIGVTLSLQDIYDRIEFRSSVSREDVG